MASLHKKRKRGGTELVSERDSILDKSSSPESRITAIQSAYLAHKDSLENLVHKDASFFSRSIKKAGKCLLECCNGEIPTFLEANPDFNVASKYKCSCAQQKVPLVSKKLKNNSECSMFSFQFTMSQHFHPRKHRHDKKQARLIAHRNRTLDCHQLQICC